MSLTLVLKPRVSEKTYALSEQRNVYTFVVPTNANKLTVAQAVTSQYKVAVTNVNIVNVVGKPKRTVRKGGRPTNSARSNSKKAYVTLKVGDSIPIFAAATEKPAEKEAKS